MNDPYILDLRDLMDNVYGAGQWVHRTAPGNGSDIGPALAAGLTGLRAKFGRGKILIPPGTWELTNPPTGDLLSGNTLEGVSSQASIIFYNKGTGAALSFTGNGGYTGGGLKHLGLLLEPGFGQSSAYAVLLRGNATYQPDQTMFEDLYITASNSGSYWWDGFHADGSARAYPQGIRIVDLRNIQIFNCHNTSGYFSNCVGWSLTNFGTYVGSGTGADVYIQGRTTQFSAMRLNVNGTLHLSNCNGVYLEGLGTISADGSAKYIQLMQ